MGRFFLPVLIATYCIAVRTSFVAADGLESYVKDKMAYFTTWIKLNNLDPSPPMSEAFQISNRGIAAPIETEISKLVIENYSEGSLEVERVRADLPDGYFSVSFVIRSNISYSGYHKTNATVWSSEPISADGRFWINISYIKTFFGIDFAVGSSSYLNATRLSGGEFQLPATGDAYFENVTDSKAAKGYEELVKTAFIKGLQDQIRYDYDLKYPFRKIFLKYWQSVLAESTLTDVMGATDPPKPTISTTEMAWSTEPITSETTSTYYSTPDPCEICGSFNQTNLQNGIKILAEIVTDIREGHDGNGNAVIIETKFVVTQKKK